MTVLDRLSARERVLLGAILPLALIVAGYRLAWSPIEVARAARSDEIARYRMVAMAADHRDTAAPAAAPVDRGPLATRITRSADAAGLSLRRLEPDGTMLRVSIDEAAFADVMGWLAALETEEGVRVAAIQMDRRLAPGAVSAQITLEEM